MEMNRKVWLDSVQEKKCHTPHKKEETTYSIIVFLDQVRPGHSERYYMITYLKTCMYIYLCLFKGTQATKILWRA